MNELKKIKLFTWLDVRRIIRQKTNYGTNLPEGILKIRCYSDSLEIYLSTEEDQDTVIHHLKNWFKDWYQKEESLIFIDIGDATLPVEFIIGEEPYITDVEIRPFWEEIAYLKSESETENAIQQVVKLPAMSPNNCNLIAFYSFKGGVGRTLNLAAHLFALLDRAKELNQPIKILVIDADLEAPGLTYWNASESQKPEVSFINFLEVYHYSPIDREEALSLFAKEVKKSAKNEGQSSIYFLPAFLKDEDLLDTPILPEHLVRGIDGVWEYGNALYSLGAILEVDYIFIDLRAGLSEISSPIIFDPRIQRFLVTTINDQSIQGTSLVLKQIGKVAPPEAEVKNKTYYDPTIIISMLKEEFKELPNFNNAVTDLVYAYGQDKDDKLSNEKRLEIKEAYFAEELLYINNWDDARSKLRGTTVRENALNWANQQLVIEDQEITENIEEIKSRQKQEVTKLRDLCQKYEYAESGEGEDLLITEPLQNLATNFQDELPHVISIGAKGAGKTFNYIQLARFKYWEKFINKISKLSHEIINETVTQTHIFPFLESRTLKENANTVISEARNETRIALDNHVPEFKHSEYVDRIKNTLDIEDWNEPRWTQFWVGEIAKSIGMSENIDNPHTLSNINQYLRNKELKIIFLFDGLEDIFSDIAANEKQRIALKALIDDLPKKLSEIRQSHLGIIIFLRRDFLRYTITQNLGQFENLYRSYDLYWNHESFLRLAYWICSESNVIGAEKGNIYSITKENLITELENLWGKTLGTEKSKEAYTASWVFAALTDFKGKLQARDIVRFLHYAAKITLDNAKDVNFEKWYTNRLLPPQAIRRALKPCSEEKVREATEEYPAFKKWVDEQLPPASERKIPFAVEQFNMDQQTVRMLEEMGVIYEDKEKEEIARFYMPEIFREGLGFSGQGARPRIVALKRRVLGKGIL
ncbi:ParA family protein [Anabaena aphanizomenioides LEGE 00250]|uniref:ParA family protein n=1 Tax=Sphaerospermopsis aphanizomenoides LEGE 00250 TaxID=2777972 RepID=A0ABR9VBS0_9CYAN|nr:ParA family protein [Sphaerospermopsis aphanizomenoides]MBE9235949.1 ParA family protein [Sphaerospermopsis aphanizomenoides LEGE 00250]